MFRRPTYDRTAEKAANLAALCNAAVKPAVRGVYAPVGVSAAVPKTEPRRNPALLAMARGKPCLLTAVDGCLGPDGSTTVACHSNQGRHGKAAARKADDYYSVWGCAVCHAWLDQGPAPGHEKALAWAGAFCRQLAEWELLTRRGTESERRAAAWAIAQFEKDAQELKAKQ